MTAPESDAIVPIRGRMQPHRDQVVSSARLTIVENPLSLALFARIRDGRTGIFEFGALATQIAGLLLWEACRDVRLKETQVPNFAGEPITVHTIAERVGGVVILRAGLLFANPFRGILPDAPLHQIGIRRNEQNLSAILYGDNLPQEYDWVDRILVLDPMLATGGSAVAAMEHVRQVHRGRIDLVCLIAAPFGVDNVLRADPDCRVFTAALDERLNDRGYIIPGLGDAGDRLFGTLNR